MFYLDTDQLLNITISFLLPFFRVGAFLMALPLFGSRLVSVQVRILFAFVISIAITPIVDIPSFDPISVAFIPLIAEQLLAGFVMGFVITILFQAFSLAGQLAAMKAGLGFAMSNDPANGVTVATMGQYFLSMVGLAFVGTNGHHVMFEFIVESFDYWPIGSGFALERLWDVVQLGGWMFEKALLIVLPLTVAVLIMNVSFGVVAKASPQLNIFALGFPVILLFSLLFFWMMLGDFLDIYRLFFEDIIVWMKVKWGISFNG
ncbi:flagellar biosynthetic protein FliR [Marinomonas mediterranea]|uniref:Flagellar biosynthetic protein FliR n=1 Tax=Marinomonas mediterranea (strain ATCC 700492 / JCM 21426 / NBRC 103028 / MMB-1) TaxID=717774 RepID=F2K3J8_MARM1|nr:flagellar biosynthetic protein FliR [Marinomonas mediterranea]ADZ92437.1 flagellar biosynthetic protein FliR [Marinomonas mediterranea MMB-1]WCN10389.1 flagellar biosynthetic protein FliR [Marinomonas mediterranea]WCN14435.1 flagellar biosynthetic protein FliR [Marinomonas mediterranea]WCN18487.1 flagellar biosynthetic protein FliR [Marinomonas mediterranea MMB-1]